MNLFGFVRPGDRKALEGMEAAADGYRREGKLLASGYATDRAMFAAWGDPARMNRLGQAALSDYLAFLASCTRDSPAALVGLRRLYGLMSGAIFDTPMARNFAQAVLAELGQLLLDTYSEFRDAPLYLVTGLQIATNLVDHFAVERPPGGEADLYAERMSGDTLWTGIPSAFQLFVRLNDYAGAAAVAEAYPDSFGTPGLRGWRLASLGFAKRIAASEAFERAAVEFSTDTHERYEVESQRLVERGEQPPSWTSANVDLWAPFFRALAALWRAGDNPARASELVEMAHRLLPTDRSGWQDERVQRVSWVVATLAAMLRASPEAEIGSLLDGFNRDFRLNPHSQEDAVVSEFIATCGEITTGLEHASPDVLIGGVDRALSLLTHIPLLDTRLPEALAKPVAKAGMELLLGGLRTWVHRCLEAITDERKLHSVLIRLFHAGYPPYAQVLHGPSEYGKDIAVVVDVDGKRVLRMHQVKAGDVSLKRWRVARSELEEMFQVEIPEAAIGGRVDRREGVLVCSGHVLPTVFPVMEVWFTEQERDHGRRFELMHIDALTSWIQSARLFTEFREALREIGMDPSDVATRLAVKVDELQSDNQA